MSAKPFFDEVRSDRYWLPCVFLVMSFGIASLGLVMLIAGAIALLRDHNDGGIPAVFFGLVFVPLFGAAFVYLLRRCCRRLEEW